jgi:hypothetical protein
MRLGGGRLLSRNSLTERVGGWVFGISNTVVVPPMAAAAVPVCQSSLCV